MSLTDYAAKPRDHFQLDNRDREFAFPCCLCAHSENTDTEHPCSDCDHNVNAAAPECIGAPTCPEGPVCTDADKACYVPAPTCPQCLLQHTPDITCGDHKEPCVDCGTLLASVDRWFFYEKEGHPTVRRMIAPLCETCCKTRSDDEEAARPSPVPASAPAAADSEACN